MARLNGRSSQVVTLSSPQEPRCRLICFPHGGGGAHAFADWGSGLPGWLELLAYSPPGRGPRLREPPVDDMDRLMDALMPALGPLLDLPVMLFGHSVGALVAFEVARRLEMSGVRPLHVIVSGHATPDAATSGRMSEATDEALMAQIAALGLLSPEALASDELRTLVLEPTRADFRLGEAYVAGSHADILAPLTVFGGRDDPIVAESDLSGWQLRSKASCAVRMFDGGHFFTVSARDQVLAAISAIADDALRALPPSILVGANEDYPLGTCLHELFRAQAHATPEAPALAGIDRALDFATLDFESDLLAQVLLERGSRVDGIVAILMETSVDFVVAYLAILKAGGAYLRIAPALPDHVIGEILDGVRPLAIVTRGALARRLPDAWRTARRCISLDEGWAAAIDREALPALDAVAARPGPQSLAYCVMTSGTTGKPKGIVCPHQGAVNSYWWRYAHLPYGDGEREACNVFFVWEVLRPLLAGRPAFVIPDTVIFDPRRLVGLLEREGITRVLLTPSLLEQVLNACGGELASRLARLRMVILNGEVVSLALAERVRAALPHVTLVNDYSISECHDVTTTRIGDARLVPGSRTLPAGHVIANVRVYVLDDDLAPLPWGVPGEVYVAGPTLARGYLDLPDETAERFVADPFQGGTARMFRTGDIGRVLADGQLEIRGRARFMVKLRGYSVVPSAVEAVIARFPAVGAVAVVTVDDPMTGQPAALAAYIAGRNGMLTAVELAGLRAHLKEHLAAYAVPAHLIALPELPIQPTTGKVDRRQLPPPPGAALEEAEDAGPGSGVPAPSRDITAAMAKLWRSLLGQAPVADADNFFDLGGHSLLAIRLALETEQQFGARVDVVDVFDHPTLGGFCRLIEQRTAPQLASPAGRAPMPSRRSSTEPADIAVIGMACRFPGATSPEELWQRLHAGEETVRPLAPDELIRRGVPAATFADPDYVAAGAILEGVSLFDARYFGLSDREATLLDPQHRIFIECCHEALERAGHGGGTEGVTAGVWGGCYLPGYLIHHLGATRTLDPADPTTFHLAETGNDKDYLATRTAYLLDLKGPAINVQTSCSTGLVAIAEAAEALRAGRCGLALAGAASITFPQGGYRYVEGHIGSRSGHCRTFDAEADGTILGDGAGVVVLRRLEDALADGDDVLAVIKGYAVNNDGAGKAGFSAPSGVAQARAITAALEMARVDPASMGYVEAHGTATVIGDPIEVRALTAALRRRTDRTGYCVLGSVKPNLGHSNIAAGVAGFIKTVLMLRYRRFVPQINFTRANPELRLAETPFRIETSARAWAVDGGGRRRAGVSSFGIGGTNAHVVLEEAPAMDGVAAETGASDILPFSAKSGSALASMARRLADHLAARPETALADVAATLQLGRAALSYRRAVVASNTTQAIERLRASAAAAAPSGVGSGIVLVFPGQGTPFPGMGAALTRTYPKFAEEFDRCRELFREALDVDIASLYDPGDAARLLATAPAVQAALFSTEYALGMTLISLGVRPAALAGHSLGQIVAAVIAGLLSLDDAVRLVAARAAAMEDAPPGAMYALAAPAGQVAQLLANHPGVTVAAENGARDTVVGGREVDLAPFVRRAAELGMACRRVPVTRAFNTPLMREAADRIAEAAARIPMQPALIPVACNLTGGWIGAEALSDPGCYWSRHALAPVLFARNAAALVALSPAAVVECGPGRSLTRLMSAAARDAGQPGLVVLPAMRHGADAAGSDRTVLDQCLARLWELGIEIDWRAYRAGRPARRTLLPTYPFERESYWPSDDAALHPVGRAETKTSKLAWQDRFHVPSLRRASRPGPSPAAHQAWLLLVEPGEAVAAALEAALRAKGHAVEALQLGPGAALPAGLAAALARLAAAGPDGRVLWFAPDSDLSAGQRLEPVFALSRLLFEREQRQPLQLFVLTHDAMGAPGETVRRPGSAMVLGPLLVLQQEDPALTARLIDIGCDTWRAPSVEDVAAIVDEITAPRPRPEPQVALRLGVPWVERFDQLTLGDAQRAAGRMSLVSGPHIITGGLGRIGLTLAAHLAGLGADVVLVSRQHMPPRGEWASRAAEDSAEPALRSKLLALLAADNGTGRIHVVSADVTDSAAMNAILRDCDHQFGTIGGIFHAAGLARLEDLADVTPASLDAELAPKVAGTVALAAAIGTHCRDPGTRSAPRFVLLFSSLAATLGGLGLGAYAAANRYLDAFAAAEPERDGVPWLSVAWDDWDFDYGDKQQAAYAVTRKGLAITPDEGLAAIEAVLGEPGLNRVLVSATPLAPRLEAWVHRYGNSAAAPDARSTGDAGRPTSSPHTAYSPHEARVAAAYAAVLGARSAGLDDDFFDLGGDSLLATEIVLALGRDGHAQVRLRIADVFDHSTIRALARHIAACCEDGPRQVPAESGRENRL